MPFLSKSEKISHHLLNNEMVSLSYGRISIVRYINILLYNLCIVLLCSALPCMPCSALPCPALPCPALPCPALPCPALPCPTLLCPALPSHALPCRVVSCPNPALCPALPSGTPETYGAREAIAPLAFSSRGARGGKGALFQKYNINEI